tara:strand:- start:40 stop:363 length:324 start_codon:yes stop_codon:yes gene_type:complete
MSDALNVFMDSQRETNKSIGAALNTMAATIRDLEKHAAEAKPFMANIKWLTRALTLAIIMTAGSSVWLVVNPPVPLDAVSKADMALIIEAIYSKSPQPKLNAKTQNK